MVQQCLLGLCQLLTFSTHHLFWSMLYGNDNWKGRSTQYFSNCGLNFFFSCLKIYGFLDRLHIKIWNCDWSWINRSKMLNGKELHTTHVQCMMVHFFPSLVGNWIIDGSMCNVHLDCCYYCLEFTFWAYLCFFGLLQQSLNCIIKLYSHVHGGLQNEQGKHFKRPRNNIGHFLENNSYG